MRVRRRQIGCKAKQQNVEHGVEQKRQIFYVCIGVC